MTAVGAVVEITVIVSVVEAEPFKFLPVMVKTVATSPLVGVPEILQSVAPSVSPGGRLRIDRLE